MTHAIVLETTGGPEVLQWRDAPVGDPAAGQVRLRHTAVGLNYIDVYMRTGLYPALALPGSLGMEGAGVVEAVGDGVDHLAPGDRVAYAAGPPGAYAEARVMAADSLVRLPDGIDDRTAAAAMLKGMTAEYLLFRAHHVRAGDTVLVHAAAGGVGLILCAWARHLGCTVIGTVGSAEKAALAAAHGCDHPILYKDEDFVARTAEITGGAGVSAVFDSVGRTTLKGSMACLRVRGHLVSFGQSSGTPDPIAVGDLGAKSLTVTRPSLFHYAAGRAATAEMAGNLFAAIRDGVVRIEVHQTFPLAEAAAAHRALEARETTGSTLLVV